MPDEVYTRVSQHFDEAELLNLTLAVIAINGWNRLAIASRARVGSYQPKTASREWTCLVSEIIR